MARPFRNDYFFHMFNRVYFFGKVIFFMLIKLTNAKNKGKNATVWINSRHIISVENKENETELYVKDIFIAVKETVEQVIDLISMARIGTRSSSTR